MTKKPSKTHYGYYSLYIFLSIAVILTVAGIVLAIFVWWLLGCVVIGFGLYFAVSYLFSMTLFRETESLDPPEFLELKRDETVLDVGCGLESLLSVSLNICLTGKSLGLTSGVKQRFQVTARNALI